MMEVISWLIVFIILIGAELATLQLVSIWFAVGALGALAASLLGAGIEIQLIIFIAVSLILLILMKPVTSRIMKKHVTKTNADSLIGQTGKVTSLINNLAGYGTVVVRGQEWTAASVDDQVVIEEGTNVVIRRISGVKLIVEAKKEE